MAPKILKRVYVPCIDGGDCNSKCRKKAKMEPIDPIEDQDLEVIALSPQKKDVDVVTIQGGLSDEADGIVLHLISKAKKQVFTMNLQMEDLIKELERINTRTLCFKRLSGLQLPAVLSLLGEHKFYTPSELQPSPTKLNLVLTQTVPGELTSANEVIFNECDFRQVTACLLHAFFKVRQDKIRHLGLLFCKNMGYVGTVTKFLETMGDMGTPEKLPIISITPSVDYWSNHLLTYILQEYTENNPKPCRVQIAK